jgi:biofilm PGA synthesis N-glycosyltransferase PgaC
MDELLLLPEGWPRLLVLALCAGVLALLWLRRAWVEELDEPLPAEEEAGEPLCAPGVEGEIRRSLLIVARNEEQRLPGLLQDLSSLLDEDPALEILLADDASTDGTRALLNAFCMDHERAHLASAASHAGKAAWLARLLPRARGGLLLFSDADCRVPRRWSLALAACVEREGLAAAGGPVLLTTEGDNTALRAWQQRLWLLLSGAAAALSRRAARRGRPSTPSLWGGNLAVDRAALERAGGYAACAGAGRNEDLSLVRALARAGLPSGLRILPRELRVRTQPVGALGCGRQLARWSAGLIRLAPLHAALALLPVAWLASLALVLALRPLLGLVLVLAAGHALGALLHALAERMDEPPAGLSDGLLLLAGLPVLGLLALRAALLGEARGASRP